MPAKRVHAVHAIKRFAVLYAGGMLARRAGLVAWENNELLEAIQKCYSKARAMLPDDSELLRAGIGILAEQLATLTTVSIAGWISKRECEALPGVRRADKNGFSSLIKRHVFDNLFVSRQQQEVVEAWLLSEGHLGKALPKTSGTDAATPKEQHI